MLTNRDASVHDRVSWVVIDLIGHHGANDGDVIDELRMIGQVITNPLAALAMLLKLAEMALHLEFLVLKLGDRLTLCERFGHWLAVELVEFGLVIKRLQVARPAGHV
jgi:hypothetical protein